MFGQKGTRPAEILHARPFEIKLGNVTDKRVRIAPTESGNAPSPSSDQQNLYSSLPWQAVRAGEITRAIPKGVIFGEIDHSGTRQFTYL